MLARRKRHGDKMYANKREPRAVMKMRKRTAQESAATYRRTHDERLESARNRFEDARGWVREDRTIRVDLPDTEVPRGRVVLNTRDLVLRTGTPVDLDVAEPDRIAVLGANGAGKTTLLHTIAGLVAPSGRPTGREGAPGSAPQRLDVLDPALSFVDNVADRAPGAPPNAIRAQLARFLFRGAAAGQLADPAPQLLLLDEPTNNLDFASFDALVTALSAYRGALIIAQPRPHLPRRHRRRPCGGD